MSPLELAKKVKSVVASLPDGKVVTGNDASSALLAMASACDATLEVVNEAEKPFQSTLSSIASAVTGLDAPQKAIFDNLRAMLVGAAANLRTGANDFVAGGLGSGTLPATGKMVRTAMRTGPSTVLDTLQRIDNMKASFGYQALAAIGALVDKVGALLVAVLDLLIALFGAAVAAVKLASSPIVWIGALGIGGLLLYSRRKVKT